MVRIKKSKKRLSKNKNYRRIVFWSLILLFSVLCSLFSVLWFSGWNGKDPLNIVVSSGENLWVLSLRPDEKQAVSISIPPTAFIEMPGRGKWQSRALWEISRLENDPSLVAAAGWNLLEVPVDLILRLPRWRGRQTPYLSLSQSLSLSLLQNLPQEFRIIKFIRSLDETQIKDIDLSGISISRRVVDPGGAELIEINPDLLSPRVEEWFRLDSLRREGLTVAIRNDSSRSGAGSILSRQLDHVGLRVVSVTDGTGGNILTVKSNQLKKSLAVRKLSAWLKTKPIIADFPDRADILIVLK